MKKIVSVFLVLLVFTGLVFGKDITVRVNNNKVDLKGAEAYIDKANRTLVPIKFIADYLQAETKWDNQSKTATVTKNNKEIVICIPCKKITIDKEEVGADSYGALTRNRTYVPLAIIAKAFDVKVTFDNNTKTIDIFTDGNTPKKEIDTKAGQNIDTSKMPVITNFAYKGKENLKNENGYLDATGLNLNIELYGAGDTGFGITYDHRNAFATYLILNDGSWLNINSSTPESATYLGNHIGKIMDKIIFEDMNSKKALLVPVGIKIEYKKPAHLKK